MTDQILNKSSQNFESVVEPSPMGLELPEGLSFEAWERTGIQLGKDRSRCLWKIGDWWIFGERYDTRRYSVPDHFGVNYHTCENCASVARAFVGSRRRESLSFAHHAEVARLPPEEADRLLDWCEQGIAANGRPRSRRELRAKRDEVRREEVLRKVERLRITEAATPDAPRKIAFSSKPLPRDEGPPLHLYNGYNGSGTPPSRDVAPAAATAATTTPQLDESPASGEVPADLHKLRTETEPESLIHYNLATIAEAIEALSSEELSQLATLLSPKKRAILCGCDAVDPSLSPPSRSLH